MKRGVAWASALLLSCSGAAAQEAASFQGKTVLMVIGFAAGGGTDGAGRLIASHLGKYLPGQPNMVVQNMPGADGMSALNFFVQQVKPDGLTITMGSGSQVDPLHYRKPQAKFDPTKFAFIGGIGRGGTALMISKDAEKRLFDKNASPVIMGSLSGMPRSGMQTTAWGKEFLGWNAKWVVGYRGTSELAVALERGEIDMTATGSIPLIQRLIETGRFKILAQSGTTENGRIGPRAEFGNAPVVPIMMQGKIKDPLAAKSFDYWATLNAMDKWLALPPGTPPAIVDVYRQAFDTMVKDPRFIERGKTATDDFAPTTYQEVEAWVQALGRTAPEAIDFISVMLRGQGVNVE